MAAQHIQIDAAHGAKSPLPGPSQMWCNWQALKGADFRRLPTPDVDLRDKWVILTGGNSGVGREAALQFVKWGANVILGCRQPPPHEMHPDVAVREMQAAALAAGHDKTVVEWWECDMSSLKSVETFGQRWLAKGLPLDILANNAGMGGVSEKVCFTSDGFEVVHQVNFISHVLLTLILLPSLARASQPRIICTTSCMQYFGIFDLKNANSGRNSYANNKLYFQTWLTELQARMSKSENHKHIIIHGVHPGYVQTSIWAAPVSSMAWLEWTLAVLLKYVGINAQQGSLAITNTATAVEWGPRRLSPNGSSKMCGGGGRYANRTWEEEPMPQTLDPECRRKVWEFVCQELKLEEKDLLTQLAV